MNVSLCLGLFYNIEKDFTSRITVSYSKKLATEELGTST